MRWITAIIVFLTILGTPILSAVLGPWPAVAPEGRVEYFLPAGFVFGIVWTVIYVGLLGLAVYQWLPTQQQNRSLIQARPWLIATGILNMLWMAFAVTGQVVWTVPVLILMEIAAWLMYFKLGIHRGKPADRKLRGLFFTVQVYVGWLSVATIANTAAALNVLAWDGFGIAPVLWTVIMIGVGTFVAGIVGYVLTRDRVYLGVFVFAYVGIAIGQAGVQSVVITSLVAALIVLALILAMTRFQSTGINQQAAFSQ